jgi:hypothetical protein
MIKIYIGFSNGLHHFQNNGRTFSRRWKPQSSTKPMTPSQLKAEIAALEG